MRASFFARGRIRKSVVKAGWERSRRDYGEICGCIDQNLFNYQAKILKELAERESYVCVGRACDFVLKDYPNVLKVFIYAPENVCIEREMERQGISRKDAEKYVQSNNRFRKEYYKYHTGKVWESPYNYDLCISTAQLKYEESVKLIEAALKTRFGVEP